MESTNGRVEDMPRPIGEVWASSRWWPVEYSPSVALGHVWVTTVNGNILSIGLGRLEDRGHCRRPDQLGTASPRPA